MHIIKYYKHNNIQKVFIFLHNYTMVTKNTLWTESHTRNPLKIYFLIMTLVGVIWTVVAFGILAFNIGKQVIITDDEYIMGDRHYQLEECKYNNHNGTKATAAEITQCEEEKKVTLIQSRKVIFKEDVLGWTVWGIVFLVLLCIHYPRFMKITKKD